MRKIIDLQMKIGETAISGIQFDLKSRDEIPKLLCGLQAIYCNREVRAQVFEALTKLIPSHIDTKKGPQRHGFVENIGPLEPFASLVTGIMTSSMKLPIII